MTDDVVAFRHSLPRMEGGMMNKTMKLNLPALRAVLYTDTIAGNQVCRDDLWAVSTDELNAVHAELATLREENKQLRKVAEEAERFRSALREDYTQPGLKVTATVLPASFNAFDAALRGWKEGG